MMKIRSIEEMLAADIGRLLDMEKQVNNALPKLIKEAQSTELKELLDTHLSETSEQIDRLEEIAKGLDLNPAAETDQTITALLASSEKTLSKVSDPSLKDTAITALCEKIEHYEMAGYETVIGLGEILGMDTSTLEDSLGEEKSAALKLRMLSESRLTNIIANAT